MNHIFAIAIDVIESSKSRAIARERAPRQPAGLHCRVIYGINGARAANMTAKFASKRERPLSASRLARMKREPPILCVGGAKVKESYFQLNTIASRAVPYIEIEIPINRLGFSAACARPLPSLPPPSLDRECVYLRGGIFEKRSSPSHAARLIPSRRRRHGD